MATASTPVAICWSWGMTLLVLSHLSTAEATSVPACGKPQLLNRIVGGEDAKDGEWPWIVSIQKNHTHHCAGSLLTDRWIVTAAHCFKGSPDLSLLTVLLGAWTLSTPGPQALRLPVAEVRPHPIYAWKEGAPGDIALVRLASPAPFSEHILPICLPEASVPFPPETLCWIAGWGSIRDGVSLPPPKKLQKLEVPIIAPETCSHLYRRGGGQQEIITPDMLCAGYREGKKDACLGDSGGPLMCQAEGSWLLAGIISWGEGCAERDRPGVYIRLTTHQAWIRETVQEAQFIQPKLGGSRALAQGTPRGLGGYRTGQGRAGALSPQARKP
ncbi:brain-specific serine protease 4 [Tachyglossus aculeatus]|uniref:brain-specific serine protease 4 n=1 Tax=Tachyglossus aculeatus TaxID=9261 RepID=UPI0018F32869|nr:brain-specific serine protease 4 [Tachyglossus aculeatus]